METTTARRIDDDSNNEGNADDNGDNGDNHNGNDHKATMTRPQQQDLDNKTMMRYNNQLNGGLLAVDCNDDDDDDGNSNGNGNGYGEGDGDSEGNGGSTCCNDNDDNNNNNPLPVVVNVVVIQCLRLCRAVTTTAAAGRQGGSCRLQGGSATATALAATMTTSTMTTTIPCLSLLTSSSSGATVFVALDRQWQWDGDGVAVIDKAGKTVVDRDKHNGATCCNDKDNHPYPVVADVVIIWRLCLCGNGMAMAAVGRQRGGKDMGRVDAIVQPWWGGEAK
jgi:hypothetical protein